MKAMINAIAVLVLSTNLLAENRKLAKLGLFACCLKANSHF